MAIAWESLTTHQKQARRALARRQATEALIAAHDEEFRTLYVQAQGRLGVPARITVNAAEYAEFLKSKKGKS